MVNQLKEQALVWQVNISGGLNKVNFKYTNAEFPDLASLKEQTEAGQWGKSFGIGTSVLSKDKWLLSSDVEFHESWSKFDYQQVDALKVLKEDHFLKVWVDGNTGDTLRRNYEDSLVDTVSTRTVIHHIIGTNSSPYQLKQVFSKLLVKWCTFFLQEQLLISVAFKLEKLLIKR